MQTPGDNNNMTDIRKGIDQIDVEFVELLSKPAS